MSYENRKREISNRLKTLQSEAMELMTEADSFPNRPLTWPPTGASYRSSDGPYESFGSFLQDVRTAGLPGGRVNDKLFETRAASGLSEGTPSQGGYLVQSDFASQLIESAFKTGKIAERCDTIELSSNSNRLEINGVDETSRVAGSRWGGIRAYWLSEASEKTKCAPKFRKIKLKLNKLIGLCYATDELLDDVTALEGIIRRGFASEFGFMIDDAIINGTGAGQPLGIMNAGCLVTQDKVGSQTATTIVYENIISMWSRLLPSSHDNAVWLANPDTLPQLAQMSVDGSGNAPVFLPAGGATARPYATIFGRPLLFIEQAQTLGTLGDLILCEFSQYLLARKGGLQADMSIHIRFQYDESCFRFVLRADGSPAYSSAVSAYKGSNSMSPFVALQTRS